MLRSNAFVGLVSLVVITGMGASAHPFANNAAKAYDDAVCREVAVQGDYAYLVQAGGLTVLNVSEPGAPVCMAWIPLELEWPQRAAAAGARVYILDTPSARTLGLEPDPAAQDRIVAVDVSNPQSPALLGAYALPWWLTDIAVEGERVYASYTVLEEFAGLPGFPVSGGLLALDLTDMAAPVEVFHRPTSEALFSLAVEDGVAAAGNLVLFEGAQQMSLLVFDAGGPGAPDQLAAQTLSAGAGTVWDLALEDGMAYAVCMEGDTSQPVSVMHIVDVSTPAAPETRSTRVFEEYGPQSYSEIHVAVEGARAYVCDSHSRDVGVYILDVSNPAAPQDLGTYSIRSNALERIVVQSGMAYITEPSDGLYIVDMNDPQSPEQVHLHQYACVTFPRQETAQTLHEQYQALVDGPLGGVDPIDMNGDGLPEALLFELVAWILADAQLPYHDQVAEAYTTNRGVLGDYPVMVPYRDCLAALILASEANILYLLANAGLPSEGYEVVRAAKSPTEPLSGEGDLDGDGYSNAEEYSNVLAAGGTDADFLEAVLNPLLHGGEQMPVAAWPGLALLLGLCGAAGVRVLRKD